ncbi:MAG: insulinase family protein [Candidatus Bathyarchaeota archaeon]|nr:insulinase family protein [Candidatus Bathyarchaeota archaeon]
MNSSLSWKRDVLPNGLRVLRYPRSSAMTAQISVAVEYGSIDDCREKSGAAHFLEHMLVGGSQQRITLHHEIEKLGGCSNFETTPECTFSWVNVFPGKIGAASKVLSGLLFDSNFEKDKFEIERKVILNEIAEASDDPRDKIGETLIKCLFKNHPVKNPILGTRKTVNQLTINDLEKSHQNYYAPKNMILILTGNFSENDAETVISNFQNRENNSHASRYTIKPEESQPRKETVLERSGINQSYISFGLRTVPAADPDMPAIDLIDSVLGTGESSRLFVELREKRALTYDFASINMSGLDYGFFSINCAVKTKAVKQTQTIIQDELEKLKKQQIAKTELEKSKNMLIGNILRAVDDYHELPRLLADIEIHFENENSLQTYINRINQLTKEDITHAAEKYFQDPNYATAILTPKK